MNFYGWQKKKVPKVSLEQGNLGGVGIVFIQAPDKSLFVKNLVQGSGAEHSGIKCGDCLIKARHSVLVHIVCRQTAQLLLFRWTAKISTAREQSLQQEPSWAL